MTDTKDADFKYIDELRETINRLQADKEALIAGQETLQKALAEKNAKIEALQMDNAQLQSDNANANMNCEHLQAEIKRFEQIETTVNEFWCVLQKFTKEKLKEKPTLEELLEYIEHTKAEAIKDIAEKVKSQKTTAISCDLFEEVVRLSDVESIINETVVDAE